MSKPYQVVVEEKPGYVHFRVTGSNSPGSVRGYLADVYYTCAQHKHPAILIEENLQGSGLGLLDIFEIVSEGSERTWPYIRRIAFVDVNPEHSQPDMKFAETVAVNRGVNMRLFPGLREAELWLSESPAVPA